jgi:hypothetical protein
VKAESEDFKNALFLAMELRRATWLVATFAPRLGSKISVHAIPGGDTKRLLELIGRLQAKLRGKDVSKVRTVGDIAGSSNTSSAAARSLSECLLWEIPRRWRLHEAISRRMQRLGSSFI